MNRLGSAAPRRFISTNSTKRCDIFPEFGRSRAERQPKRLSRNAFHLAQATFTVRDIVGPGLTW